MKMKRKVIVTYVILSILPIAGLNVFTYQHTKKLLLERESRLAADAINQAALQVDYQLQLYDTLSDYIFNDSQILAAVNQQYDQQFFKMYKMYTDTIGPAFQTYFFLHPQITGLTIFTSSDLHPYGGYVQPLALLEEQSRFDEVEGRYQPTWQVVEKNERQALVSVRQMARRWKNDTTNYLYMELDYQSFFSSLSSITSDAYGLVITDAKGNCLYMFDNLEESPDRAVFAADAPAELLADNYMLATTTINAEQWTVYYYRPLASVTESVTGVIRATFVMIWLVLILLGVLAWVFSFVIVSPLELLTQNMRQVQLGDMQVTVHTKRNDEIGVLIRSFSDMLDRINHLIEVVYKNEIEKREYQLTILRAQINPHFLYNSLLLINSRAIVAGQDEISRMALLISSFYRTALNRGQDVTTVENELANTRAYISIQLLLNADSFVVSYDIVPDVLPLNIPHFILQPIVENSIGHGLLDSLAADKRLNVSAGRRGDFICLQVEDNGVGMPEEVCNQLLHNESSGYGLKNVNERLALLYGQDYRFMIDSREGLGTTVTLLLAQIPLPPSGPPLPMGIVNQP